MEKRATLKYLKNGTNPSFLDKFQKNELFSLVSLFVQDFYRVMILFKNRTCIVSSLKYTFHRPFSNFYTLFIASKRLKTLSFRDTFNSAPILLYLFQNSHFHIWIFETILSFIESSLKIICFDIIQLKLVQEWYSFIESFKFKFFFPNQHSSFHR